MTTMNSQTGAASPTDTVSLRLWRPSVVTWLLLGIALLVSAWPFMESLAWLWESWSGSEEYSHGVIMPLLTVFLIWTRREQLEETRLGGSWAGVVLVVVACLLYAAGRLAALHVIDNLGFWLLLCGIALAMTGLQAFRIIALPMVLLLLAIPLPTFFLNNISSTLQTWSSQLGVAVIRFFGISVLLLGNVIDLGQYKLEVAEACSGVRYLFPLVTIGMLMAYLYHGAWWKRVVIALSSLPLTLLMNSLRIGSIGVMVDRWGPSLAEGFVHEFQGWAMFMLTGALMLGLLGLLHRMGGATMSWREAFGIPPPAVRPPGTSVTAVPPPRPFVVSVVIICLVAVLGEFVHAPKPVHPARQAFVNFPDRIDGRDGRRQGMNAEFLDALQLDDYLLSDYVGADATVVGLYMAYYNDQQTGRSVHSPKSCLPGGGWVMTQFGQRRIDNVSIGGHPLYVNRAIIELGNDRQLVYYWFQQRGRSITSEFSVKWYLLQDGLLRHRTDGALVRVITPLPVGSDLAAGDARLASFIRAMGSSLPDYVPN